MRSESSSLLDDEGEAHKPRFDQSAIVHKVSAMEARVEVMIGWQTSRLLGKPTLKTIERQQDQLARDCCHAVVRSAYRLVLSLAFYVILGCIFYGLTQNWTILECVFFCTVTISTVGYGGRGLEPDHTPSRMFTIFYIFFGIIIVFTRLTELLNLVKVTSHRKVELALERRREARRLHGVKPNEEDLEGGDTMLGFWHFCTRSTHPCAPRACPSGVRACMHARPTRSVCGRRS